MSDKRVVMVVDMQNGVFETPRRQRERQRGMADADRTG